jgi:hypothetical protein
VEGFSVFRGEHLPVRSSVLVYPRALRASLRGWWLSRLERHAPLAALAVPIPKDAGFHLADSMLTWLQSFQALEPLVYSVVFTDSTAAAMAAGRAGLPVEPLGELSFPGMVSKIAQLLDGGDPLFWGTVDVGASFPDATTLVDTLYGVGADVEERGVPPLCALLARGRQAETESQGSFILRGFSGIHPDSREWRHMNSIIQELPFEPQSSHSMVLLSHSLARTVPATAVSPVQVASRLQADGKRVLLVDITDTAHVFRMLPSRPELSQGPSVDGAEYATFSEWDRNDTFMGIYTEWRGEAQELPTSEELVPALSPSPSPLVVQQVEVEPSASPQPVETKPSASPTPTADGPLISVFTTLMVRPSQDEHGEQKFMIQRNTLMALKLLEPEVELTVFTDSEQTKKLCDELSVRWSSNFTTNSHGTPYLKSMFLAVEGNLTRAPVYGYCNADILFDGTLVKTVKAVLKTVQGGTLKPRVLVVGQRTNFQMPFPFHRDSEWALKGSEDLSKVSTMVSRGRLFQTDAQDYFFMTRGTFNWETMPDMVIGRLAYDNWIVDHAYHAHVDRVDATKTLHAVHQTGTDGNKAGHIVRPDKDWNLDLFKTTGGGYDHGHTYHTNWESVWVEGKVGFVSRPRWNR